MAESDAPAPCTMDDTVVKLILTAIEKSDTRNRDDLLKLDNHNREDMGKMWDALNKIKDNLVGWERCETFRKGVEERVSSVETASNRFEALEPNLLTQDQADNRYASKEDIKQIMEKLDSIDKKMAFASSVKDILSQAISSQYLIPTLFFLASCLMAVLIIMHAPMHHLFNLPFP